MKVSEKLREVLREARFKALTDKERSTEDTWLTASINTDEYGFSITIEKWILFNEDTIHAGTLSAFGSGQTLAEALKFLAEDVEDMDNMNPSPPQTIIQNGYKYELSRG